MRGTYNILPFKLIPARRIVKGLHVLVEQHPANDGISKEVSPRTIINEQKLDYN